MSHQWERTLSIPVCMLVQWSPYDKFLEVGLLGQRLRSFKFYILYITIWCPRKIVLVWHSQLQHETDACSCQFEWWHMFCFALGFGVVCLIAKKLNIFLYVYWPFKFFLCQLPVTNFIHFSIGVISSFLIDFKEMFLIDFSLFILVILTLFVLQTLLSLTLTFVF